MILELVFILGLIVGLSAALILFFIYSYEDKKAEKEFNERQERYKKMI